ncbi:adenylate cyclase [Clydaea vesicula]|uniref:N-acyl-aliphatic-L-amino acid amidohydrolase n=1 Tax=Clydaea vesicula TaxID=447962 RepID=A0AAD5Y314_9FUNG|nr:adenylate cyclase [Clydaea vesicula]
MNQEIENFIKLVKINTISGSGVSSGGYRNCAKEISNQCREIGLDTKTLELVEGKPIVVASHYGEDRNLPSLLLTGHYDVVPCDPEKWTVDPFADEKVYGRGTQDMKCCLAAYIECLRRIKGVYILSIKKIKGIGITLIPLLDEEIGGADGMGKFVETNFFRSLNVGFALDEGLASPTHQVPVYFGERAIWWIKLKATGDTGHASRYLAPNGAMEKIHRCCDRALAFREKEAKKYRNGTDIGDIITLNLTSLKAGKTSDGGLTYALNVIPSEAEAGFDIRIPPTIQDLVTFENDLKNELTKGEDGIEYILINGMKVNPSTSLDIKKNLWWERFQKTCLNLGLEIVPQIFPAATDSRFLRAKNIPCLGFTPIPNTKVLFHDHDEYLPIDVYMNSITIYLEMIKDLVNLVD